MDEFRERMLEEYGPEGLGANTPKQRSRDSPDGEAEKPEVSSQSGETEKSEGLKETKGREDFRRLDGDPTNPKDSDASDNQATTGTTKDDTLELTSANKAAVAAATNAQEPNFNQEAAELNENPADAGPLENGLTAEVGGFNRNDNRIVVIEQERGADGPGKTSEAATETPRLHRLPADSEARETRTLEAVDYGKGAVVRCPKTDLENAGYEPEAGKNSIARLEMKDVESEEVETVFARYVASDRRAEAYVGGIGGEKGSRYELLKASEYNEDHLVRDFNRGKCEHLQNVRLEHSEDMMFVNVDDRRVEWEECHLATSGSYVILRGKLDGEDNCKVEFDGRRASVRFGRDYPVEEMRMEGDQLVVSYAQSRNEKHEHRLYLEHLEPPERPSLKQFDGPEVRKRITALDYPERNEGLYRFVLDKETQKEIGTLLREARKRGDNEYDMMKAEVSERLGPSMLELVGWERIKRHPFNETTREGASANGTDWLLRTPDKKLTIVEVKWWGDVAQAELRARRQVATAYDARRPYDGQEIEGAYVVIIDWKIDDSPVKIFVKRVRPEVMIE